MWRQPKHNSIHNVPALQLLSQFKPESVGAVVMDPPFFTSTGRADNWNQTRGVGADPWLGDLVGTTDEMVTWSVPLANAVFRALRPGGACVVMGGAHSISAWQIAADRAGLIWMSELTVLWNMGKPRLRNFGSLTTTIRWHIKPGARHMFNSGDKRSIYSNVLVCSKVPNTDRAHPAQKPVELTNFIISLLTTHSDVIVDPFCGSGSTLVSAEMCDRPWVGGDIDVESCRIAELRTKRIELEAAELKPLRMWINGREYEVEG